MKVISSAQLPKTTSQHTVWAIFVSENNIVSTQRVLNSAGGWKGDWSADWSAAGKKHLFSLNQQVALIVGLGKAPSAEDLRNAAFAAVSFANEYHARELILIDEPGVKLDNNGAEENLYTIAESLVLSNYQFLTYKTKDSAHSLKETIVLSQLDSAPSIIDKAGKIAQATCVARDLVNEPPNTLTATEFSNRMEALGKEYGFSVEVMGIGKIRALKMGGILAVNAGSIEPPTFNILEYKPENPANTRPVVLVGKGVVYDTGGLSLKPTKNSMDFMKSDMAGAAAVVGAMCALAAIKANCHVIGLIPATDNRPGENAFTPGDVIKMYDGSTVEILNTDAEGRMILADALAYAKQYNPELVIDLATLTGAAVVAIGSNGIAMMSTADADIRDSFKKSGDNVYERLVELPLWQEYGKQLKSDIADISNLGGAGAGAITAGKFLEHFTDYPWIHLDIAGASYLHQPDTYRGKNGTGTGVRLLTDFLEKKYL